MSIKKEIRPITYLKTRAADLVSQVNEWRRPVVITQKGEPRAVIQDAESYERMRSALGMMKILAQGEADARSGKVRGQRRVFSELRDNVRRAKPRGAR